MHRSRKSRDRPTTRSINGIDKSFKREDDSDDEGGDEEYEAPVQRTQQTRNTKKVTDSSVTSEVASEEEMETYTICGETRVRMSTAVEGGYSSIYPKSTRPIAEDNNNDLDILQDENFGDTQFNESDLARQTRSTSREKEGGRAPMENETATPTQQREDVNLFSQNEVDPDFVESDEEERQKKRARGNGAREAEYMSYVKSGQYQNNQLVIRALKAQIQDMEKTLSGVTRCTVCMSNYVQPLVSTQCWHVHCEDCWLSSLSAKRLCPQCNVITLPSQLRRIFLQDTHTSRQNGNAGQDTSKIQIKFPTILKILNNSAECPKPLHVCQPSVQNQSYKYSIRDSIPYDRTSTGISNDGCNDTKVEPLVATMQEIWKTLGGSAEFWRGTDVCDPTNYIGVTCDTLLTHPTSLLLSGLSLNGSLSPSIGTLHHLTRIDLSSNRLGGIIPYTIGHLTELENLKLSRNRLTGCIPSTFSGLLLLQNVDVSHNRMEGSLALNNDDDKGEERSAYKKKSNSVRRGLLGSLLNITVQQAEIVKTISDVALSLSSNATSFVYSTPNVSISLQAYNLRNISGQYIKTKLMNTTVTVAIPISVFNTPRVSLLLSSVSFNPFVSMDNQSIFSRVIGVALYSEGREIEVKDVTDSINITMGIIDSIPPDHHAVCQYWNEYSSLWSREGCNLVVDGNVTMCQTNHLTNFSIGIQPIVSPSSNQAEVNVQMGGASDKKKMIVIASCVAGGLVLILVSSLLLFRLLRAREVDLKSSEGTAEKNETIEWKERVSGGGNAQVWKATRNETITVAIKRREDAGIRSLVREATRLKTMHHPNIVMYLAQNLTEEEMWLKECLTYQNRRSYILSSTLTTCVYTILLRITEGSIVAKITSFSECTEDGAKYEGTPSDHTAPEVVKFGIQYVQSDVWSFGLILLFIARDGRETHQTQRKSGIMIAEEWEASVKGMIHHCTREEIRDRPTFSDITKRMSRSVVKQKVTERVMEGNERVDDPYGLHEVMEDHR
ncbi:ring finger protein [Planoprotostelium fungivorum]|uniref:Ring finger protein n=1 Tax=Planoprotostelium fungivorum TaxID=1890364 RepID=A0A2P6N7E9_9EUKA|nr:ring finger protein [Planoprotostelium fungivorum]